MADRVELQVFFCKEAYVYQIPPATTVGHRADTWDVNKWLSEVAVRVVTCEDDCFVRLEDHKTGELFAECPVPQDAPLLTVVEPVIDSSRYFAIRIVDRDTGRHAFVGLGFRERSEASNFNAALYEHGQYLKRKRVAEARRREFEEREQRASEGSEASEGGEAPQPAVDYSIKPGEKITIKLNVPKQDKAEGFLNKGSKLSARFNLFSGGEAGSSGGGLALAPPPAPRRTLEGVGAGSPAASLAATAMCISPRAAPAEDAHGAGEGAAAVADEGAGEGELMPQASGTEGPGPAGAEAAAEGLREMRLGAADQQGQQSSQSGAAEEDDWGDFTSS